MSNDKSLRSRPVSDAIVKLMELYDLRDLIAGLITYAGVDTFEKTLLCVTRDRLLIDLSDASNLSGPAMKEVFPGLVGRITTDWTVREFAAEFEYSTSTVNHWIACKYCPEQVVMKRIMVQSHKLFTLRYENTL